MQLQNHSASHSALSKQNDPDLAVFAAIWPQAVSPVKVGIMAIDQSGRESRVIAMKYLSSKRTRRWGSLTDFFCPSRTRPEISKTKTVVKLKKACERTGISPLVVTSVLRPGDWDLLCLYLDYSQGAVAELCGISPSAFSDL